MYHRPIFNEILERVKTPRKFIQVLVGPRQVGKTTLSHQLEEVLPFETIYASADGLSVGDVQWIGQQWERARLKSKQSGDVLLILDEIQKIHQWSESVKRYWEEDTKKSYPIKLVLLGSSALLLQQGLTESLAGRIELINVTHWSFEECQNAFGWDIDQYIYFGGYPGSAELIDDERRWSKYIRDSLITTSVNKDVLMMTRVQKPALLRRVFELGCLYSGQILSFQKMLGQLQDAGNASTISHYLDLLSAAGLITGIQKYASEPVRQKASSPKLQVFNTALISAQDHLGFETMRANGEFWGRQVESAVGAHLINSSLSFGAQNVEVFYWRDGNYEVDFILRKGHESLLIEVKSTKKRTSLPGISAFIKNFGPHRSLLVGSQGIPVEEFLLMKITDLF
jgi:predicted AAA+ superfamily ATPase